MLLDGRIVEINKPLTMGIVNITPDSFYEGSRYQADQRLLEKVEQMINDGLDILDLGAYSTRPGADDVPIAKETETLCKAIEIIRTHFGELIISADTFRSDVARSAIDAGANLINDISGGNLDDKMFDTIAELKVPYVLMHSRGTPKTMKELSVYEDVVNTVIFELSEKVNLLRKKGVKDIIIDPGFGFAKNISQNFEMLNRLNEFEILDCLVLIGISRKSMIWKTLNTTPENALNGTSVLNTLALYQGANILRVHDVKEAKEAIELISKLSKDENYE